MRIKKAPKYKFTCVGGPWHGREVLMPMITMVIHTTTQTGRYVEGRWEDV